MTQRTPESLLQALVRAVTNAQVSGGGQALVAIDGPAGAGKTTLAAHLAGAMQASVFHMDDFYDGWDGLSAGIDNVLNDVVLPLAHTRELTVRRYDWSRATFGAPEVVFVEDVVIIEGVGAGAALLRPQIDILIYVDAPEANRHEWALSRGGENFESMWDAWAVHEAAYFDRDRPHESSDVRYDSVTGFWEGSISP